MKKTLGGTIIHFNERVWRSLGDRGTRRFQAKIGLQYIPEDAVSLVSGALRKIYSLHISINGVKVGISYRWLYFRGRRYPEVEHLFFQTTSSMIVASASRTHISQAGDLSALNLSRIKLFPDVYHEVVKESAHYMIEMVNGKGADLWMFDGIEDKGGRVHWRHAAQKERRVFRWAHDNLGVWILGEDKT